MADILGDILADFGKKTGLPEEQHIPFAPGKAPAKKKIEALKQKAAAKPKKAAIEAKTKGMSTSDKLAAAQIASQLVGGDSAAGGIASGAATGAALGGVPGAIAGGLIGGLQVSAKKEAANKAAKARALANIGQIRQEEARQQQNALANIMAGFRSALIR